MSESATMCPMCDAAALGVEEGHLDQSGRTFLPTTRWSCPVCGYARYEPAVGVRWRAEQPAPLYVVTLRAA